MHRETMDGGQDWRNVFSLLNASYKPSVNFLHFIRASIDNNLDLKTEFTCLSIMFLFMLIKAGISVHTRKQWTSELYSSY